MSQLPRFLVYLAGPITGLTYDGAVDWRDDAIRTLYKRSGGEIAGLSPMRHKEYLKGVTDAGPEVPLNDATKAPAVKDLTGKIGDSYEQHMLSSQRGIFYRDKLDCTRADLVLVNFLGAKKVSIGTVMEIAWADANGIPVVVATEGASNPHNHAMLREASKFVTPSLEEALDAVYKILMPDLRPLAVADAEDAQRRATAGI